MASRFHGPRCPSLSIVVLVVLVQSGALPPPAGAQRLGTEFQVDTFAVQSQSYPAVAVQPSGDFVVVWQSYGQDGSHYGIFARRFSSAGAAQASEFQVNTVTYGRQFVPQVAAGPSGNFVVIWQADGESESGYTANIFAQRFSSAGTPLGGELQVNPELLNSFVEIDARLADLSGGFIVTWTAYDASGVDVSARRFSSAGEPVASEFQVNEYTDSGQSDAVSAAGDSGDFVVVWQSYDRDGDAGGIFARRFSSTGAALASEFQVNSSTTGFQGGATVSAAASGDFVVVWLSNENGVPDMFGQLFSSSGTALASQFQINLQTEALPPFPRVASGADGDFVVIWETRYKDGDADGVFGRSFSRAGVPLTNEFPVNSYTSSFQSRPAVAAAASGDFVVAWQSNQGTGGIFAQRFASFKKIDIDGDGVILPLTDGLLVLRSTFGFTGQVLVNGAVNLAGCTRCDAATIEPYLKTLN